MPSLLQQVDEQMSNVTVIEKAFYTIPELMARWSVGRSTIYREIGRGAIKRKHVAGTVRIAAEDVKAYENAMS